MVCKLKLIAHRYKFIFGKMMKIMTRNFHIWQYYDDYYSNNNENNNNAGWEFWVFNEHNYKLNEEV